jgi:FlaA1/EpsC-like NDP-sugar epimerase
MTIFNSAWLGPRFEKWWQSRRPTREAIVVTAMLVIIFELAYLAAFFVRGELLLRPSDSEVILATIGWVIAIKVVLFYWRGFCHRPWRAARFEDLNRLLRTSTISLLVLVAFNSFAVVLGWPPIPRSVLLLDWVFTLIGVGGMQAIARSVYEEIMPATPAGNERAVLLIDASEAGRSLALMLPDLRPQRYFVSGLLDDNPEHYGLHVGKARVLGPVSMAPMCAERLRVSEIIVRQGSVYGERLRSLCDACAVINVRVRIAEDGSSSVSAPGSADQDSSIRRRGLTIRPIKIRDIAMDDLLSRPHAHLHDEDFHVLPFIADRCVLVTPAARRRQRMAAAIIRQVEHATGLRPIDQLPREHGRAEHGGERPHGEKDYVGHGELGVTFTRLEACATTHAWRRAPQHTPGGVRHMWGTPPGVPSCAID